MRQSESPTLQFIGHVESPFKQASGTPIQARFAHGVEGQVLLLPQFASATADLLGFERIWLLFWMDRVRSDDFQALVVPYRDTQRRGLFATRSPCRPNPIGLSCVRLLEVDGGRLTVGELDLLDGTPILDIKPYVPSFDAYPEAKAGWLDESASERVKADERFHGSPPGSHQQRSDRE